MSSTNIRIINAKTSWSKNGTEMLHMTFAVTYGFD